MSGPALLQRHAHHAIHASAYGEAEELTDLLADFLREKEGVKATTLVPIIIEHWQTRTLVHADEEEHGLYEDVLTEKPKLAPLIHSLKRDHHHLRILVTELVDLVGQLGTAASEADRAAILETALDRCKMLLWVNRIHSETEETVLLADSEI